jgi:hypothetical protein
MYRYIWIKATGSPRWKIYDLYRASEGTENFNTWVFNSFNGRYNSAKIYDQNGGWDWEYYFDFETEEDLVIFKIKTGL